MTHTDTDPAPGTATPGDAPADPAPGTRARGAPAPSTPHARPDAGLTRWFVDTTVFGAADATSGPTTEDAYADYLARCPGPSLPRHRFVHDLGLLGIHEHSGPGDAVVMVRG